MSITDNCTAMCQGATYFCTKLKKRWLGRGRRRLAVAPAIVRAGNRHRDRVDPCSKQIAVSLPERPLFRFALLKGAIPDCPQPPSFIARFSAIKMNDSAAVYMASVWTWPPINEPRAAKLKIRIG
jgi:hypothetical protein